MTAIRTDNFGFLRWNVQLVVPCHKFHEEAGVVRRTRALGCASRRVVIFRRHRSGSARCTSDCDITLVSEPREKWEVDLEIWRISFLSRTFFPRAYGILELVAMACYGVGVELKHQNGLGRMCAGGREKSERHGQRAQWRP